MNHNGSEDVDLSTPDLNGDLGSGMPVYLDYNATSPVAPQVLTEMMPYFARQYGNASSSHAFGREAARALETARGRMAALLRCHEDEIVFTGGGSEANNMAIKGAVLRGLPDPGHIITSVVDHPSVQQTCSYMARRFNTRVTSIPVDRYGMVSAEDVADAVAPETTLISIMLANNEVGTLQPAQEIVRLVRAKAPGVLIHTDAAQAVGKVPVDISELGVDLLTVAAHKLCGPKGVGALYIRRGVELDSLIHGSGHEGGRRAGTQNVPAIAGLGMAAELARTIMQTEEMRLEALRDHLQEGLCHETPDAVVNGHPSVRLPNTLNIAFPGKDGNAILAAAPGVAASTGSACHSGSVDPSSVLIAMGVPPEIARGALRLSLGRFTTECQIETAIAELARSLSRQGDRRHPSEQTLAAERV